MNKLKEIHIRQFLLAIAWIVYVIVWTYVNRNPSDLDIMIGYGIPWIGVMLAMLSLAEKARKEKNKNGK